MSGLAAGRARVRAMLRKCFRMQRMVTSLNATAMATAAEAFDALFPRYGIVVKRLQHLWGLGVGEPTATTHHVDLCLGYCVNCTAFGV